VVTALGVLETLEAVVKKYPNFKEHKILERIFEPERVVKLRVPWKDMNDETQIPVWSRAKVKTRPRMRRSIRSRILVYTIIIFSKATSRGLNRYLRVFQNGL